MSLASCLSRASILPYRKVLLRARIPLRDHVSNTPFTPPARAYQQTMVSGQGRMMGKKVTPALKPANLQQTSMFHASSRSLGGPVVFPLVAFPGWSVCLANLTVIGAGSALRFAGVRISNWILAVSALTLCSLTLHSGQSITDRWPSPVIGFTRQQILQASEGEIKAVKEEYQDRLYSSLRFPFSEKDSDIKRVYDVWSKLLKANPAMNPSANTSLPFDEWDVKMVHDRATRNAWALPNGQVYVFNGLLNRVDTKSDDELAVVTASEVASEVLLHREEQLTYKTWTQIVGITWAVAVWTGFLRAPLPRQGAILGALTLHAIGYLFLVHLPIKTHKAALEWEANEVGLDWAEKAGYKVDTLRKVLDGRPRTLYKALDHQ